MSSSDFSLPTITVGGKKATSKEWLDAEHRRDLDARTSALDGKISAETSARESAMAAEAAERGAAINAEAEARGAAVEAEAQVRAEADVELAEAVVVAREASLALQVYIGPDGGPRFVLADFDGGIGAEMGEDRVLRVDNIRLLGAETAPAPGWAHAVTDPDGGVAAGVDLAGMMHILGLRVGGAISADIVPGASHALELVDRDGGIAYALDFDNLSPDIEPSDPWIGEPPQQVQAVWVEPWGDASRDVVVSWLSDSADGRMRWRMRSLTAWAGAQSGWTRAAPDGSGRWIHSVLLRDLPAATAHDLGFPSSTRQDGFRTSARRDVTVAWVSDIHFNLADLDRGAAVARGHAPDLIVLPGDLASDNGTTSETMVDRWIAMLERFRLYRSDGALVPIAMVVGNHERTSGIGGVYGPMSALASAAFDIDYPGRRTPMSYGFSVGPELYVLVIDTGWATTIADQVDWITDQIDTQAPLHRHVMITGHGPAFGACVQFPEFDTVPRAADIRNLLWPVFCRHAAKVRAYVCGHEHILTATAPLVTEYDPGLSDADNWARWRTVAHGAGVRQIGSGPVGGTRLTPDEERSTGAASSLDGSPRMLAAYGIDIISGEPVAFGDVISPEAEPRHIWITTHAPGRWTAEAVSIDGSPLYSIIEDL